MAAARPRFVQLLGRAQRALQRWIEARPESWEGISAAQVGLLFVLRSRQGQPAAVGEIAGELGVAPAAVTNLSKRMQAAGMLERVADEQDARLTRLRMTGSGREASARAGAVLVELNARLAEGFTPAELQIVARWLARAAALEPDAGPR
ncbi:MarR family transcriptional regulator [Massilia sp. UMI-21]|nr:MarR family transcriptional regulator [Massilia sp. UMI-21]